MKLRHFLTLLVVLSTCIAYNISASATTLRGVADGALNGETINVRVDNRVVTVRLSAVTVPAKGLALADVARSHLDLLTKGKQVSIDYNSLARDGSIVGIVTVDGVDIGMQMIRDGAALYNRTYEADLPVEFRSLYDQSEQAARREARGIWENRQHLSGEELEPKSSETAKVTEPARLEARRLSTEARELMLQGNNSAAMGRLREAIKLDPEFGEVHKNLALLFCNTGRFQDALPEAREAVRLSPTFDKAYNVMGMTLGGLGDFEGAVKAYERAIALNPRYGIAYYNLAFTYQQSKQFQKALDAFEQAERVGGLSSLAAKAQLNLGYVLYQLGRHAEARLRWQKVLTMDDPLAAALAEQNLSNIQRFKK